MSKTTKLTQEEFIGRCKLIHGDRYDYSLVDYKNSHTKIKVICSEHGEFEQLSFGHMNGRGCSKCSKNKKITTKEFIERSVNIHRNKYDYTSVSYNGLNKKVNIFCKEHGMFSQTPEHHMKGHGCPFCNNVGRKTNEQYIEKAKKVHNNSYDYSHTQFISNRYKIKIICHKHGEFEQNPKHHLSGSGCPKCKSSQGENKLITFFNDNSIKFQQQKSFDGCKYKKKLKFDFFLKDFNTCIEYDGEQHFKPVEKFGGGFYFEEQKLKDIIKTTFCKQNNINLIRIGYKDNLDKKLKWLKNYLT